MRAAVAGPHGATGAAPGPASVMSWRSDVRVGFETEALHQSSDRAQRDIGVTASYRIVGCGRSGRTVQQGHRIVVAVLARNVRGGRREGPLKHCRPTIPLRGNVPRWSGPTDGRPKPICTGAAHTSPRPTNRQPSALRDGCQTALRSRPVRRLGVSSKRRIPPAVHLGPGADPAGHPTVRSEPGLIAAPRHALETVVGRQTETGAPSRIIPTRSEHRPVAPADCRDGSIRRAVRRRARQAGNAPTISSSSYAQDR